MRAFLIKPGYTFVVAMGLVLAGGARIELEDDVAHQHAEKLDPAPVDGVDEIGRVDEIVATDVVEEPVRFAQGFPLVRLDPPASMDMG
jgi:hypothetical protein